ncbi:MAG TPA: metal-dependent hydrolase [Rhodospirillaceae bacterium]|nr:metal-dependent hydrolase [Rhodospirillaceae bacterium]
MKRFVTTTLAGALIAGFAWAAAPAADAHASADVKWYGQAAFRIKTPGGKVIVIDPFITKNPKTPADDKDLAKLGKVDLILVTHGHGDHIGDTAALAKMTGAKVGVNADMGHTMRILGMVPKEQLIRFNKSGPITPLGPDITITMTHAEHSSEIVSKKDGVEAIYPGGEPAGYIIKLEDGYTIYHSGDTGVFKDMELIHDLYKPDLALICIGGWFTMDPRHAAYAVNKFLKPKTVMPMHYGTFGLLKGTPDQLKTHLSGMGDTTEIVVMQPGDEKTFGK